MGTIGFGEIVFLLIIGLLIFGPDRLPEMARKAGNLVAKLKTEANSTIDEIKRTADLEEFQGVAEDLRRTGADLRRAGSDLTQSVSTGLSVPAAGAVASERGRSGRTSEGRAPGERLGKAAGDRTADPTPAPFDPDAP